MEKVVKIIGLHDRKNDYEYWMSKSAEERIAAIEFLRQQYFSITGDVQQGFQRVYRVIRKTQG